MAASGGGSAIRRRPSRVKYDCSSWRHVEVVGERKLREATKRSARATARPERRGSSASFRFAPLSVSVRMSEHRAREKFAVLVLVEPGVFDVEEAPGGISVVGRRRSVPMHGDRLEMPLREHVRGGNQLRQRVGQPREAALSEVCVDLEIRSGGNLPVRRTIRSESAS